jgi:hypothetical protein
MMEEEKIVKSIKLRGQALDGARRYNELLDVSRSEYQKKHDEAARELRMLQSKHVAILRQAWCDMVENVFTVPDAETTWQNSNYRLDITYLNDHHEAFLNIYTDEKEPIKIVPPQTYVGPSGGGLIH